MNSKLNSPYEINKNIQILKCDLSKFPNEELNNQVNKIQPLPKNDSFKDLYEVDKKLNLLAKISILNMEFLKYLNTVNDHQMGFDYSRPQLLKDCYFCKEAIDHVCLKLFKNHKSCINCLNMTIANQKILKCSNCRKNYEIYRQKYEKKRDTSHVRHKKNFLSAAKNEAERKEMLGKEINGIDNSM